MLLRNVFRRVTRSVLPQRYQKLKEKSYESHKDPKSRKNPQGGSHQWLRNHQGLTGHARTLAKSGAYALLILPARLTKTREITTAQKQPNVEIVTAKVCTNERRQKNISWIGYSFNGRSCSIRRLSAGASQKASQKLAE